jgi:hypothetical protein
MPQVEIRDHTLWTRHLIDAAAIKAKIEALAPNRPISLQIDGKPILFRKMRDGVDGRPTPGIRPDDSFKAFWNALYNEKRGERVPIALDDKPMADPYLASFASLLSEWDSAADDAAYNDL